jgi:predicted transcriptional regulator
VNEAELSNLSLSILEIIAQQRDIHILLVKGQLQEMSKITGQTLEDSDFNNAIHELEQKDLIKELESKPKSYTSTSKGKSVL